MQNHHAGGSSTMIFKTPPRPTQRKVGGTPGSCVDGSPPNSSSKSHDDLNNIIADKLRDSGVMTSDQLFEVARPYYKQTDCKSELSQWARARIANLRKKRKVWPTAHMVFGTIKMQGRKRDASVGEVGMWEFEGLRKSIRPEKFYEAPRTVYWSWEHGLAKHALSAAYAGDEHTPGTASLASSAEAVDNNGEKSGATQMMQHVQSQQLPQQSGANVGSKQLTISSSSGGLNFTEELVSPTFVIRGQLNGTHLNDKPTPSPLATASQAAPAGGAANTQTYTPSTSQNTQSDQQTHQAGATSSAYTTHGGALKRSGDPRTADPQSVAFHEAIESIRANMTTTSRAPQGRPDRSTNTGDARNRSGSGSSPRAPQEDTVPSSHAEDAALLLASAAEISRRESSSSPPRSDTLSQSNPEGSNRLLLLAQIAQSEISKHDGDSKNNGVKSSGMTEHHLKRTGLSPKKQRTLQSGHPPHPSHLSHSPVMTAADKAGRPPPPRKGGPHRGAKYRCGRCGYYPKSMPHDCMTGQAFPRTPASHPAAKIPVAAVVAPAVAIAQVPVGLATGAGDAEASTPSTPPESPRYQSRPKHYACGKCGFFPKSAPHDCRTGKATTANAKMAAQSPKRKHLRREPNPSSPNGGEGGGRPRQYRCGKCGYFPKADKHDCDTGLACPQSRHMPAMAGAATANVPGDAAGGAAHVHYNHHLVSGNASTGETVISSGIKGVSGVHRHDSEGSGSNNSSPTRASSASGTPIGSPSGGSAGMASHTSTGRRRQYKCGKCNFFPKTTPHDCALYQGNTSTSTHTPTHNVSPPQQQQQSTFPVRPVNVRTVYPATAGQQTQYWGKHANTTAEHVAASALLYSANRGMNRA